MKYLFISGAPETGKTETIFDLTDSLLYPNGNYNKVSDGNQIFKRPKAQSDIDFQIIIDNKINKVLINSATDDKDCIDAFLEFLKNNSNVDVVISSIRDGGDNMRDVLLNKLNIKNTDIVIEIPLAKITRYSNMSTRLTWYRNTINNIVNQTIKNPPFSL